MEHKHKGVARSNGTLRSHPVQRQHKDSKVKLGIQKHLLQDKVSILKQYTSHREKNVSLHFNQE